MLYIEDTSENLGRNDITIRGVRSRSRNPLDLLANEFTVAILIDLIRPLSGCINYLVINRSGQKEAIDPILIRSN